LTQQCEEEEDMRKKYSHSLGTLIVEDQISVWIVRWWDDEKQRKREEKEKVW